MAAKPPAKSPADRVKATRLRHKLEEQGELGVDDMAWLNQYGGPKPIEEIEVNASASAERVVHIEERSAAAQGNHPHPDAYAAISTAEGLRADTLMRITMQALIACNDQYRVMALHLLERTTAIEDAHVEMLEAVRDNYLGRIEAEAEARLVAGASGEDGELAEMLKFWMAARAQHQQQGNGKKSAKKKPTKRSRRPLGTL